MIPTWKTDEKDKKSQKIGKNGYKRVYVPPNRTDFEFSQGNNCKHMH